ncbi:MAG: hypothetical protein KKF46_06745 [Nanoarchaeota archaeon]|nr:hypothetical protein [Nanoarchaeota archaeon]MBU1322027.1 hypothetical protein [Nanoarchaeota archaeon]MBU1597219.1 hypothetical protein [Nanoarchaeota archaeon]MBU2440736.1 hypothetical protein [Nanoarchaeota archaeon]
MAPSNESKARVNDYVEKNKQATLEQDTLDHKYRSALNAAEESIYTNGLLDYKLLKTEAGKDAYKFAFKQKALPYAFNATGHGAGATLDVFQQSRIFSGTYGFGIDDFNDVVDQYEDRTTFDLASQVFAQALDTKKKAIGAIPTNLIKSVDAEAVIDYTDSSNLFDVTKLDKVRDLTSILNEHERNHMITPNYLDRLERQHKPFLKPRRRIIMP